MKVLLTGASSGIGRDMTDIFVKRGYTVYAVARREERLIELKSKLGEKIIPIKADLNSEKECIALYEKLKNENLDIVINNAGLGVFGEFCETDLNKELRMIDTNIKAVHILTKLFLKDFKERNSGYILNVASLAGFMMGPLLSSYYASKAYVLRLTQAINRELKEFGSKVHVCVLCPGPVKTEFDAVANVKTSLNGLSSYYVAQYAINKMFKKKTLIIPGLGMKVSIIFSKLIPESLLSKITYMCQSKKK